MCTRTVVTCDPLSFGTQCVQVTCNNVTRRCWSVRQKNSLTCAYDVTVWQENTAAAFCFLRMRGFEHFNPVPSTVAGHFEQNAPRGRL